MMTGPRVASATVVGAGVVGLSCAIHLAAGGVEVTVVDGSAPGSGASRSNAGWLVPSMCEPVPSPASLRVALRSLASRGGPLAVGWEPSARYAAFLMRMLAASTRSVHDRGSRALERLGSRALSAFDDLEAEGVEPVRRRRGVSLLFLDRHHLREHGDHLEAAAGRGSARVVRMGVGDLREAMPSLGRGVVGGLHCPDEQHVDPSVLVDALTAACRERGVTLLADSHAFRVRVDGGEPVVATTQGDVRADAVVVAAGVGSRTLLGASGVRVPVRAGKGYGVDYTASPVELPTCTYLAEHRVALTPLDGRLRLAGTMAFGDETARVDRKRVNAIVSPVGHYLEGWPDPPADDPVVWSGLRPMTPDGLPLIGRLPGHDRVVLATGHAMLGVTLGPLTGSLVADLLLHRARDEALLHPFRPTRMVRGALRG
jgi:D-amino-acid dehydrogenase